MSGRLARWMAVGGNAHSSRRKKTYKPKPGTDMPVRVIARALGSDVSEEKVAKARARIVFQINRFLTNKEAKVYTTEELARCFGQEAARRAIENLTPEEEATWVRALRLRAVMSQRKKS